MLLKLSYYKFNLEYNYVKCNLHGNQKEDSYNIYTKGNKKKFKHFATKKVNYTQKKAGMQEMRDKKAIRHIENRVQ